MEDAVGADEVLDDDLHQSCIWITFYILSSDDLLYLYAVDEELVLGVPLELDELLHDVDALGARVDDAGADGVGQQVVVQQVSAAPVPLLNLGDFFD